MTAAATLELAGVPVDYYYASAYDIELGPADTVLPSGVAATVDFYLLSVIDEPSFPLYPGDLSMDKLLFILLTLAVSIVLILASLIFLLESLFTFSLLPRESHLDLVQSPLICDEALDTQV